MELNVGVLALQGAYAEHADHLKQLGDAKLRISMVRTIEELAQQDALILPGGESTAMALIAERWGLIEPLREWMSSNKPVFGTCAGLILMADEATGKAKAGQTLLGGLHVKVNRNHFGRQLASFETPLDAAVLGELPPLDGSQKGAGAGAGASNDGTASHTRGFFIRAPGILSVGEDVQVLASIAVGEGDRDIDEWLQAKQDDIKQAAGAAGAAAAGNGAHVEPVAVRQGNLIATTFHPELTKELRWHQLFVQIARDAKAAAAAQEAESVEQ